jgi:hypothetical protein
MNRFELFVVIPIPVEEWCGESAAHENAGAQ